MGRFLPTKSARIGRSRCAVDQHREPNRLRPAEVVHGVEGGADRAAGEEHVVDEHDDLAVDAPGGDLRGIRVGRAASEVVAVHRHVERADRDSTSSTAAILAAMRRARGTPREGIPSSSSTGGALVALEDLVSDAGQRAGDVTRIEERSELGTGGLRRTGILCDSGEASACRTSFSASQDGSLKDVERLELYPTTRP